MSNSLGYVAFHGYAGAMEGKTHDGKFIPRWIDLGDKVQNAWECAALMVMNEATQRAAQSWNLTNYARPESTK